MSDERCQLRSKMKVCCVQSSVCCVQSSGEDTSPSLFMSESSKRKLADLSPQVESESARRKMENVSGIDYCEKIQVIIEDVKVKGTVS